MFLTYRVVKCNIEQTPHGMERKETLIFVTPNLEKAERYCECHKDDLTIGVHEFYLIQKEELVYEDIKAYM